MVSETTRCLLGNEGVRLTFRAVQKIDERGSQAIRAAHKVKLGLVKNGQDSKREDNMQDPQSKINKNTADFFYFQRKWKEVPETVKDICQYLDKGKNSELGQRDGSEQGSTQAC